ncbi:MAG: hypothetical protein ACFB2X_14810 [Rivularia sp. (in: cyanobacteria)]
MKKMMIEGFIEFVDIVVKFRWSAMRSLYHHYWRSRLLSNVANLL